jgi:preprotein translocase subunit SecA
LDQSWKDHLLSLDHLRQGINLRAYAQSNPLNEYKNEAFNLFAEMLDRLREEAISILAHFEMQLEDNQSLESILTPDVDFSHLEEKQPDWFGGAEGEPEPENGTTPETIRRRKPADTMDPNDPSTWGRVQRNAACPCGSGKKYKHCHGQLEVVEET